ncbi:hypothetical protein [Brevibacillus daliensis]|uniref:hypothetical protein n=1 Tax=Brevibacillus daliensis TaxID=2892995 RepID=UPI001E2886B2|nr:hypothetical protein [Brevibacillus daliensis]
MDTMKRVTPGTKVYKLFEDQHFVCEGTEEVFLISVKKLSKEDYQKKLDENPNFLQSQN